MPAQRTIGNYVLGALLGRGGMSEVYAADHRFLGDRVAIKLLRAHLAGDPRAAAGFLAEATRTRAIDHPSVVRVIDFGSDGDDCYLVMELVDGESLAARLARITRLAEPEVRRLGAAIADGVAAAHARGIVHRDLKPGNIMLAGDAPKIVDFGIARTLGGAAGAPDATGPRLGSLAYMAPEQLTGGLTAPCIDVWALGVTLYEALTGHLPFADFANGRAPQLFEPAPRAAARVAVSPELDALIAACLARDPAQRPASMHAIADALRGATGDARVTEELGPEPAAPFGHATGAAPVGDASAPVGHASAPVGDRPAPVDNGRVPIAHLAMPVASASSATRTRHRTRVIAASATLVALVAIAAAWRLRAHAPESPSVVAASTPIAAARPAPTAGQSTPPAQPNAAQTTPPAAQSIAAQPTPPAEPNTAQPNPVQPNPAQPNAAQSAAAQPASDPAAAKPAPFTVEVRSAPTGAAVLLAGKRVGVTPATIALDVPAALLVTRRGYRPSRVRAERAGPILVRLVPAAAIRPRHTKPVAGETLD